MSVGNYVMLNPAVPTEAYDGRAPASDVDRRNMTHPEWRGAASDGSQDYIERVMSAGWSTLFSSSDTGRRVVGRDRGSLRLQPRCGDVSQWGAIMQIGHGNGHYPAYRPGGKTYRTRILFHKHTFPTMT